MRAIVVLFDTLNRRFLPPYGAEGVHAPNFERLARHTVQFDNCYGGSMPCMPARREMHTGRYNFLHRGWGPLEPFDDSVPEMLGGAGVYTHLVTDHQHYWLDGGATYHPRFRTFELFRGQEGDEWKGRVADPDMTDVDSYASNRPLRRQDQINRQYMRDEADHPQTRTFDAGLHFIDTNADSDKWMLQIETFDPHEPFFSYKKYHDLYDAPATASGRDFDWPDYKHVTESEDDIAHLRARYRALLSMCDASLGRVLDVMDEREMWHDTMLIVCTDHGLLLGEHEWLGKNVPPFYDETIHTPLFVWDPRTGARGQRREQLVQTIDFGPTLLDLFDVDATDDMQGQSLSGVIAEQNHIRETALFGIHGGHANVTDGRYVYMRAPVTPDNQPLAEYTLMPTSMRGRFPISALTRAELVPPLSFSKGVPVLKVPAIAPTNPAVFGSLLFDLETDPEQEHPLLDPEIELRMAGLLVDAMRRADAPDEQYVRLGLPRQGDVTPEHLVLGREAAPETELTSEQLAALEQSPVATRTVAQLLDDPAAREVLRQVLGPIVDGPLPDEALGMSLLDIATVTTGMIPAEAVVTLAELLPATEAEQSGGSQQ
ncbi:sulfatase [Paramicrobacterium chengjingii]|uniref:Sulfatase n=1 Tax=Paramicrobacterium chengjingii TaxID=2769067 RepID=A0ABX6YHM6_9MICO|nr:sulfatase [Microbacterium chengjingii]QPZ38110.1 sulfatase [Microbacterium chengjingii]